MKILLTGLLLAYYLTAMNLAKAGTEELQILSLAVTATNTGTIEWVNPTHRIDDTELAEGELGGILLYYISDRDSEVTIVDIPGGIITKYTFPITTGDTHIQLRAYDSTGLPSIPTAVKTLTVNPPKTPDGVSPAISTAFNVSVQ